MLERWAAPVVMALSCLTGACAKTVPSAENPKVFYLNQDDLETDCGILRNEDLPYDADSYCSADDPNDKAVAIPSFLAQQPQTIQTIIMDAIECVYRPLPVTFTAKKPEGPHRIIHIGGKGKFFLKDDILLTQTGAAAENADKYAHDMWVVSYDADGNAHILETITKTTIHEIGHAFGLSHTTEGFDFMKQGYVPSNFWHFNPANAILLVNNTFDTHLSLSQALPILNYLQTSNLECEDAFRKVRLAL